MAREVYGVERVKTGLHHPNALATTTSTKVELQTVPINSVTIGSLVHRLSQTLKIGFVVRVLQVQSALAVI